MSFLLSDSSKNCKVLSRSQPVFGKDCLCSFLTVLLLNAHFLKHGAVRAKKTTTTKLHNQNNHQPCLPPLFKDLLQSCDCKLRLHVLWLCPPPQACAVGYHSSVCLCSTPCERAVPTLWAQGEWWENTCGAVGITVLLGAGVERAWQRGQAVLTQV